MKVSEHSKWLNSVEGALLEWAARTEMEYMPQVGDVVRFNDEVWTVANISDELVVTLDPVLEPRTTQMLWMIHVEKRKDDK